MSEGKHLPFLSADNRVHKKWQTQLVFVFDQSWTHCPEPVNLARLNCSPPACPCYTRHARMQHGCLVRPSAAVMQVAAKSNPFSCRSIGLPPCPGSVSAFGHNHTLEQPLGLSSTVRQICWDENSSINAKLQPTQPPSLDVEPALGPSFHQRTPLYRFPGQDVHCSDSYTKRELAESYENSRFGKGRAYVFEQIFLSF